MFAIQMFPGIQMFPAIQMFAIQMFAIQIPTVHTIGFPKQLHTEKFFLDKRVEKH